MQATNGPAESREPTSGDFEAIASDSCPAADAAGARPERAHRHSRRRGAAATRPLKPARASDERAADGKLSPFGPLRPTPSPQPLFRPPGPERPVRPLFPSIGVAAIALSAGLIYWSFEGPETPAPEPAPVAEPELAADAGPAPDMPDWRPAPIAAPDAPGLATAEAVGAPGSSVQPPALAATALGDAYAVSYAAKSLPARVGPALHAELVVFEPADFTPASAESEIVAPAAAAPFDVAAAPAIRPMPRATAQAQVGADADASLDASRAAPAPIVTVAAVDRGPADPQAPAASAAVAEEPAPEPVAAEPSEPVVPANDADLTAAALSPPGPTVGAEPSAPTRALRILLNAPRGQDAAIDATLAALREQGFAAEEQPSRFAVGTNSVRYYNVEDAAAAAEVAALIGPLLPGGSAEARDFTAAPRRAGPGKLEIYVAGEPARTVHRGRPAAVAPPVPSSDLRELVEAATAGPIARIRDGVAHLLRREDAPSVATAPAPRPPARGDLPAP